VVLSVVGLVLTECVSAHPIFLAVRGMTVQEAKITHYEVRCFVKIETIATADEIPARNLQKMIRPCERREAFAFTRLDVGPMRFPRDDKN